MGSPWPFATWGKDVIGPIEPDALNGHHFILVAIDYFTKWVEPSTYKAVTKKVVADFARNNIVCRFGIPKSIITDNAANLNIKVANKNIKRILRNIVDNQRQWNEKLSFALLGYRTTMRTSTGAMPYMLVYGTEAVIPAEVKIPSLRVTQEVKLDDTEWIQVRHEKLMLIDEKRMDAVCHD
ncbi:uncharacterized protein LOC142163957 [Nicotiana tabacum]|uniref:Uncharacterized protein LOC142163957 n=1 Tax=Nicotiana tabacum TaxID=4097 RepID=A0AC58RX06_TOBAC